MPGQGNAGTSPALPVPLAPSRGWDNPLPGCSRCTVTITERGAGRETARHRSVPWLAPRATAARQCRRPPGRNIEKDGSVHKGYPRQGAGRAHRHSAGEQLGSSPRTHSSREGTWQPRVWPAVLGARAAKRPPGPFSRALGSSPPGQPLLRSTTQQRGPTLTLLPRVPSSLPAGLLRGAGKASALSCRLPRQKREMENSPQPKARHTGPCEGPEWGWGRETGQASLRLQ